MKKRTFLGKSLAGVAILSSGLLSFKGVFGAWSKSTMTESNLTKAIKALASTDAVTSDKIKIKAPEVAENGAVVPIDIDASALGNVENTTLLVDNNPRVVGASFNFSDNAVGFAATRIKMAKSGNVIAIVKASGKVYKNQKEVKVTIGGCGG